MTPRDAVAAEQREYVALLARKVAERECAYHGTVWYAIDADDKLRCIPCARERLDSMYDALARPGESGTCPDCGEPHVWHGRTEADRVCWQCRYPEDR
jgi:hypothetical protein